MMLLPSRFLGGRCWFGDSFCGQREVFVCLYLILYGLFFPPLAVKLIGP